MPVDLHAVFMRAKTVGIYVAKHRSVEDHNSVDRSTSTKGALSIAIK